MPCVRGLKPPQPPRARCVALSDGDASAAATITAALGAAALDRDVDRAAGRLGGAAEKHGIELSFETRAGIAKLLLKGGTAMVEHECQKMNGTLSSRLLTRALFCEV